MADSLSTVGLIAFGIFIAWTIYLPFIVYIPIVFLYFIKLMEKILFSSKEYILVFGISLAVMIFRLYIPMELSGDFITVFVFLPTVFLYNTKEKKIIMKSSIKIILLILLIKLFLKSDFMPNLDDTKNKKLFLVILMYFRAIIFSTLYTEFIKVLSIVLSYLKLKEVKK